MHYSLKNKKVQVIYLKHFEIQHFYIYNWDSFDVIQKIVEEKKIFFKACDFTGW